MEESNKLKMKKFHSTLQELTVKSPVPNSPNFKDFTQPVSKGLLKERVALWHSQGGPFFPFIPRWHHSVPHRLFLVSQPPVRAESTPLPMLLQTSPWSCWGIQVELEQELHKDQNQGPRDWF